MRRLAILIVVALPLTWATGDDGGPGLSHRPSRTDVLVEFPIRSEKGLLVVPVTFQGRSYPFIIDTGTSHVVFDKSLEAHLGPPVKTSPIESSSGRAQLKCHTAPEAMLGPLSLATDEVVFCADLSHMTPGAGRRIYGMVGMTFLRKYALTLDYGRRVIQLRHEAEIDEPRSLALRLDRLGCPLLDVTLPGEPPRAFELDTGSYGLGGSMVDRTTYARLLQHGCARVVSQSRSVDLSGQRIGQIAEARRVEVAGVELPRIFVSEAKEGKYLLGLDTIHRLNLVLDFPRRKMSIAPAEPR